MEAEWERWEDLKVKTQQVRNKQKSPNKNPQAYILQTIQKTPNQTQTLKTNPNPPNTSIQVKSRICPQ